MIVTRTNKNIRCPRVGKQLPNTNRACNAHKGIWQLSRVLYAWMVKDLMDKPLKILYMFSLNFMNFNAIHFTVTSIELSISISA